MIEDRAIELERMVNSFGLSFHADWQLSGSDL